MLASPAPPAVRTPARPLHAVLSRLGRQWLRIDPREATFARRGFQAGGPAARERLEAAGLAFLRGYHAALDHPGVAALGAALDAEPSPVRGFAYEGAGMALALLDRLTPWRRDRLRRFLDGPGDPHVYMVHVGAGWALARLRRPLDAPPAGMDPLLGWLALDGYGFHEGYFHPHSAVRLREVPRRLRGYARRAFDQGVGRSLWFVHGADPERVAAAARSFGPERADDVWSGVGLASAYAGGAPPGGLEALAAAAGSRRPALAQGAAFAAKARARAGNPAPHTESACRAFAGVGAAEAAAAADEALRGLAAPTPAAAYDLWRARIRNLLAPGTR